MLDDALFRQARELAALLGVFQENGLKATVDAVFPAARAREALERLPAGDVFGKIVLTHSS
ncbi:MAG: zinc-binding dehydrogenase [bacterium]